MRSASPYAGLRVGEAANPGPSGLDLEMQRSRAMRGLQQMGLAEDSGVINICSDDEVDLLTAYSGACTPSCWSDMSDCDRAPSVPMPAPSSLPPALPEIVVPPPPAHSAECVALPVPSSRQASAAAKDIFEVVALGATY